MIWSDGLFYLNLFCDKYKFLFIYLFGKSTENRGVEDGRGVGRLQSPHLSGYIPLNTCVSLFLTKCEDLVTHIKRSNRENF